MKKLHLALSCTMLLIGVIHIVFATQIYDSFSFNALWFISGGLLLVFLGFINLLMNDKASLTKLESIIWLLSNLLSTIFMAAGVYVMQDTGSYIIAIVILILCIASIKLMMTRRTA